MPAASSTCSMSWAALEPYATCWAALDQTSSAPSASTPTSSKLTEICGSVWSVVPTTRKVAVTVWLTSFWS